MARASRRGERTEEEPPQRRKKAPARRRRLLPPRRALSRTARCLPTFVGMSSLHGCARRGASAAERARGRAQKAEPPPANGLRAAANRPRGTHPHTSRVRGCLVRAEVPCGATLAPRPKPQLAARCDNKKIQAVLISCSLCTSPRARGAPCATGRAPRLAGCLRRGRNSAPVAAATAGCHSQTRVPRKAWATPTSCRLRPRARRRTASRAGGATPST